MRSQPELRRTCCCHEYNSTCGVPRLTFGLRPAVYLQVAVALFSKDQVMASEAGDERASAHNKSSSPSVLTACDSAEKLTNPYGVGARAYLYRLTCDE
jgi:hypothetical protein